MGIYARPPIVWLAAAFMLSMLAAGSGGGGAQFQPQEWEPDCSDLWISNITYTETVEEQSCAGILAGPNVAVADGADVTYTAGTTVVLREDFAVASGGSFSAGTLFEVASIPPPSAWIWQGTILTPGTGGAWDTRFPHGTPGPVLKKGNTYYLYYIGADGDRGSDGGPAHRKIGVATAASLAGPWTKHPSNPLLAHSPNGDEEEGFWRLAGMVDADGTILLYATALTGSGGQVHGDVKLFTSTDGIDFTDQGIVLEHGAPGVPFSDEGGVLGAWRRPNGTYALFYTSKGGGTDWDYTVSTGPARTDFTSHEIVLSFDDFGHGTDPVQISNTELAVFLGENGGTLWAYRVPISNLTDFSVQEQTYGNLSDDQFAVVLGRTAMIWYAFVTRGPRGDADRLDLYTAPAQ